MRSARSLGPLFRGPMRSLTSRTQFNCCVGLRHRPSPTLRFRFDAPARASSSNPLLPSQFTQFSDAKSRRDVHFYGLIAVLLSSVIGFQYYNVNDYLLTEELPEPGSPEDVEILEELKADFDDIPFVQQLRASKEYVEWEPYGNFDQEQKEKRLTSGSLKGSKGVSMQRVFYNESEGIAMTVLHLGMGVEGWPNVVHGGVIGIIMDESLGRVALLNLPARTGVTANLEINYRKPAESDSFFALAVTYDREQSTDRKAVVKGELRDQDGEICAEAKGIFVVPKNLQLKSLGDGF